MRQEIAHEAGSLSTHSHSAAHCGQGQPGEIARDPYTRTRSFARVALRKVWPDPMEELDLDAIRAKLAALQQEHRDLDEVISRLAEKAPFDMIQLQRLKKRKLGLKDQIAVLESKLIPDIIA